MVSTFLAMGTGAKVAIFICIGLPIFLILIRSKKKKAP
jgi:hypothetical protein